MWILQIKKWGSSYFEVLRTVYVYFAQEIQRLNEMHADIWKLKNQEIPLYRASFIGEEKVSKKLKKIMSIEGTEV